LNRRKRAFDVFMEIFDGCLVGSKTNEQAFEDAADEWRVTFPFEPPCKNYESFRVKRSALIKAKEITASRRYRKSDRPTTYASLLFS